MRSLLSPICLATLMLALGAGSVHAQKKYRVNVHRPRKAGDAYVIDVTSTTREHRIYSVEKQTIKEEDLLHTIRFVADVVVSGEGTRPEDLTIAFTTRVCTLFDGSDTVDLLPPGTELIARRLAGEEVLRSKDNDVDEQTVKKLGSIITELGNRENDQIDHNPKSPQKVGGTWSVDVTSLMNRLRKVGIAVGKKDIQCTGRLVEVSENASLPSMTVTHVITTAEVTGPPRDGLDFMSVSGVLTSTGVYPLDDSIGAMQVTTVARFNTKVRGKMDLSLSTVEMRGEAVEEVTTRYAYK